MRAKHRPPVCTVLTTRPLFVFPSGGYDDEPVDELEPEVRA